MPLSGALMPMSGRTLILPRVGSTDYEKNAGRRYVVAEEAFLAAVRADRGRSALTALADEVAAEAKAWNAAAYQYYLNSKSARRSVLDQLAERAEVLANLWSDIAGAFHGQVPAHGG